MPKPFRTNISIRFLTNPWFVGAILSGFFAWIISAFYITSPKFYEWDKHLEERVHIPGTYNHRDEGWGVTTVGKHGVHAIPDVSSRKEPKIIIWGDSFVEAWQVNDKDKMAQVITDLLRLQKIQVLAFGTGRSGDDISDHYFRIPKFENLAPPIVAHYIVLGHLDDITPDQNVDGPGFHAFPSFRLIEKKQKRPKEYRLKTLINTLHFNLIRPILMHFTNQSTHLRFTPGPVKKHKSHQSIYPIELTAAWDFLLSSLRNHTSAPICFVYCPAIPRMKHGQVSLDDPQKSLAKSFAARCSLHGIDFIDMSEDFIAFYRDTARFPTGFSTSVPGEGHFNPDGHRIIGKRIFSNFVLTSRHNYALRPN